MYKFSYYIVNIIIGLVIAQLLCTISTSIVFIGLILLIIHSLIIFYLFNDHFLFFIYVFSLCIMNTSDKLGGIVLAPLIIFISYLFLQGKFDIKDKFVKFCLYILFITNCLGYLVKNQAETIDIIQSLIIFSGCILTFVFVQNFKFTKVQINITFKVLTFLSFVLFLVALNQKFVFIDSSIPLLGSEALDTSVSEVGIYYGLRMPSLFFDYELFSEFALMMFILSFSIITEKSTKAYFGFTALPYYLAFISLLNIIITGTRSGFLLLFGFLIIFTFFRTKNLFSTQTFIVVASLAILVPVMVNYAELIGLDYLINRFKEIDFKNVSLNNIVSGEEMNRAYVYAEGYNRIKQENWLLGYGYGTQQSNNLAWFSKLGASGVLEIRDFHSLYICMPMIYGWIGGIVYLGMVIYIIILLFRKYLKTNENPLRIFIFGLAFLFIFFLINQIKINSLRLYNYHYMIWILMGFALSVLRIKSISDEDSLVY